MNKRRNIAILAIAIALITVGGLVYKKHYDATHYKGDPTQRLPGVNYDPATARDNKDINDKKMSGELDSHADASHSQDGAITVTLVAAGQDDPQGPVVVRTMLGGIKAGSCTLTLTKDGNTITRVGKVIAQNYYYVCEGFNVEYKDLRPGDWDLKLIVADANGKTGEARAKATVK